MSDCIDCNIDYNDNDIDNIFNSSEWLIYWQLAANFSAICTFFSVCIVCYFLVAREHPSRPDETDKIEIDRFNNKNSAYLFNMNKTSLISDLGIYIWLKEKWKLLKHRLFIAIFDDPLNDFKSNSNNNQSISILVDNLNLNKQSEIKNNEKKSGLFDKFKKSNKNTNRNAYPYEKDDDDDSFSEYNHVNNESNMSIQLIKDFKYNFKPKLFTNNENINNNSNKVFNIDAHCNLSYLKLFNSILIVFNSIINNTSNDLYNINLIVNVYYNKVFKLRYDLSNNQLIINKIKSKSSKEYKDAFLLCLNNNKMNINLIDIYIFIIGRLSNNSKLTLLSTTNIHGSNIPTIDSLDDL